MDRTWMLICLDWGTNQCSLILPISSKKTIVHFNIWDTMLAVSFVTVSWESTEIKAIVLVLNSTIFMPFSNSIQSRLLTCAVFLKHSLSLWAQLECQCRVHNLEGDSNLSSIVDCFVAYDGFTPCNTFTFSEIGNASFEDNFFFFPTPNSHRKIYIKKNLNIV